MSSRKRDRFQEIELKPIMPDSTRKSDYIFKKRVVIGIALSVLLLTAQQVHRFVKAGFNRGSDLKVAAIEGPLPRSAISARLSAVPEADRMSRRLGKRFQSAGREQFSMTGILTLGGERFSIQVTRRHKDDGEEVTLTLNNGQSSYIWDDKNGARTPVSKALEMDRMLVERLALDSPDQFVFAQLRGASYNTVAREVRPSSANAEEYKGPLWKVIRIQESASSSREKPLSEWRAYYINTATGLIDKILSQEKGEMIIAELSEWAVMDGETVAWRYVWKRSGQPVMELSLSAMSFAAKQ
jgi:hypothetical protein